MGLPGGATCDASSNEELATPCKETHVTVRAPGGSAHRVPSHSGPSSHAIATVLPSIARTTCSSVAKHYTLSFMSCDEEDKKEQPRTK